MDKSEQRLLDAAIAAQTALAQAQAEWHEVSQKGYMLVTRTGPVYYKGHVIEAVNGALVVRPMRSMPTEAE